MNTFHILTLGCKINQYETQSLRERFLADGLFECEAPQGADLVLINSCAVTSRAIADLRQAVRRIRRAAPKSRVVVTGCAAQVLADEISDWEGVDLLVRHQDKDTITASLLDGNPENAPRCADDGGSAAAARTFPAFDIADYPRARAVLKVQDGCSHGCTYCIVPLARGRSVSREPDEVLDEVHRLLRAGVREMILSGINLRHWGRDLPGKRDFWDLVAGLEQALAPEWSGRARLRISSVDPGQLNDKGLETFLASSMLCPHLHLSLQSGSSHVLKRMGRAHYGPERILDDVARIRQYIPLLALGADILVGFPGEEESHFQETSDMARSLALSYAHVFPYSERPGTPAAGFDGVVDPAERKGRAAVIRRIVARSRKEFIRCAAEQDSTTVVLQTREPAAGTSEHYLRVRLDSLPQGIPLKRLVRATPHGLDGETILASACKDATS